MTYLRHIVAKSLPYPVLSVAVDDAKAVLRVLVDRKSFFNYEGQTEGNADDLKTTAKLSSPFTGLRDTYYTIQGKEYCIMAEGILDKTSTVYSANWVPGAHWSFHIINGRGIFIDVRPELSYFNKRNSADYGRYAGGMWLFDVWVTDQNAPVIECNRSITTAPDTILVTNLDDLGEEWAADVVMQGNQSRWLNLGYSLEPDSETVAPDGWVTYTLKILDGKTGEVLPSVTWDGFIVDPVDGYCPHRRVSIVNGVGTFRQQALGLQSGETMRVKIDHRFYTGRAEHTVKVA
ncbi:MAG: hypothetical protein SOT69_04840 [Mesosutterella sp.]|nr:hypothetical protein [Mesosutterella sp.]